MSINFFLIIFIKLLKVKNSTAIYKKNFKIKRSFYAPFVCHYNL
nr:MAG TPA: hypothetical protein [Caudoviricetes sp.]